MSIYCLVTIVLALSSLGSDGCVSFEVYLLICKISDKISEVSSYIIEHVENVMGDDSVIGLIR